MLQDPSQPTQMAYDSHSRSLRSKSNRPSPSSVKVPKLDLPLPPASPRRRGSTAVLEEMQSFMPLTPAPFTPRLAPASAAKLQYSPHDPTARPMADQSSPAIHQDGSQDGPAAAEKIDTSLPDRSMALHSSLEAPDSSWQAPQPALDASTQAAAKAASNNAQDQTAGQCRMQMHTPEHPAISLHHKAMKSPDGSRSSTPRSFTTPRAPASAATSELSQVFPRSWNGTPRDSQFHQTDPASSAGQKAEGAASDRAASGGPDALVDGQYTLQQLLARNEVCIVPQESFPSCVNSVEEAGLRSCAPVQRGSTPMTGPTVSMNHLMQGTCACAFGALSTFWHNYQLLSELEVCLFQATRMDTGALHISTGAGSLQQQELSCRMHFALHDIFCQNHSDAIHISAADSLDNA